MKIKAYLVDVLNEKHGVVEIENKLEDYYREIQCRIIDIQRRKIGNKEFDFICDDEGLFQENAKISAIDNQGTPMFVGNLLIVNSCDGETTTLTDEDVAHVAEHVQKLCTRKYAEGYPMITQVEYC